MFDENKRLDGAKEDSSTFYFFKRFLNSNSEGKANQSSHNTLLVKILQLSSLCLITIYYALPIFNPDYKQAYAIKVVIPRIIYVSLALAFILGKKMSFNKDQLKSLQNPNEHRFNLHSTNGELCLILLLLLLTGQNFVMGFVMQIIILKITNNSFLHFRS